MQFEWDEDKNQANIGKHGVSFKTASRIFEGFTITKTDDRYNYGEIRENTLGMVDGVVILNVTHTDRKGLTRIISARPAKSSERKIYEQALRQRTQH